MKSCVDVFLCVCIQKILGYEINGGFVLCVYVTFQCSVMKETKLENQCLTEVKHKDMEKQVWISSNIQLKAVNFV